MKTSVPALILRPRRGINDPAMRLTPLAAALAAGLFVLPSAPAHAATIPVTAGGCTLVDAITAANTDTATGMCSAGSGADTITLPANSTQTLTAVDNNHYGDNGLPTISSAITVAGNNSTIVRAPSAPPFRLLDVDVPGNLHLQNLTLSGGQEAFGGAISMGGTVVLTNSRVSGNAATNGGGIGVYTGTLTLIGSTVSGNFAASAGGGIVNDQGSVTLGHSTVSGNTADQGGGIGAANGASVTLTNSTVSGNVAGSAGGGIAGSGAVVVSLVDSTVAGNDGGLLGGGVAVGVSTLNLSRSLISGNSAAAGAEILDLGGGSLINAGNFNLVGFGGSSRSVGFIPGPSDIVPAAAQAAIIGPLASNTGPTQTHALPAGSPALNAAGATCSASDQRGISRPQGVACDIGAFELATTTGTDTTPNTFVFIDQTNVPRNSVRTSNAVTISGINAPATISVVGGGYSIGCTGVFTTVAGTIVNGQKVCVRHVSAGTFNTGMNTMLTVGGVSDHFSSVTAANGIAGLLGVVLRVIGGTVGVLLGVLR